MIENIKFFRKIGYYYQCSDCCVWFCKDPHDVETVERHSRISHRYKKLVFRDIRTVDIKEEAMVFEKEIKHFLAKSRQLWQNEAFKKMPTLKRSSSGAVIASQVDTTKTYPLENESYGFEIRVFGSNFFVIFLFCCSEEKDLLMFNPALSDSLTCSKCKAEFLEEKYLKSHSCLTDAEILASARKRIKRPKFHPKVNSAPDKISESETKSLQNPENSEKINSSNLAKMSEIAENNGLITISLPSSSKTTENLSQKDNITVKPYASEQDLRLAAEKVSQTPKIDKNIPVTLHPEKNVKILPAMPKLVKNAPRSENAFSLDGDYLGGLPAIPQLSMLNDLQKPI